MEVKEEGYNVDYKKIGDFIQEATKYQSRNNVQAKAKSFFDVSGYPHYENVVSNILQFYLDPSEEHGFKDLWLSALIECYSEKNQENQEITDWSNYGAVYDVYREFSTENGNRIDLLIKTDNFLIVIENKIYARVSNPFEDYHDAAEEEAKKENKNETEKEVACNTTIIEIILSIKKEKDEIGKDYKFINITYEELITKVLSKYGEYVSGSNYKWQLFMNEFINNLRSFYEAGEIKMDKDLHRAFDKMKRILDNYSAYDFHSWTHGNDTASDVYRHIDISAGSQLSRYYSEVKKIIAKNRELLLRIADELMEKVYITYKDIERIKREF